MGARQQNRGQSPETTVAMLLDNQRLPASTQPTMMVAPFEVEPSTPVASIAAAPKEACTIEEVAVGVERGELQPSRRSLKQALRQSIPPSSALPSCPIMAPRASPPRHRSQNLRHLHHYLYGRPY